MRPQPYSLISCSLSPLIEQSLWLKYNRYVTSLLTLWEQDSLRLEDNELAHLATAVLSDSSSIHKLCSYSLFPHTPLPPAPSLLLSHTHSLEFFFYINWPLQKNALLKSDSSRFTFCLVGLGLACSFALVQHEAPDCEQWSCRMHQSMEGCYQTQNIAGTDLFLLQPSLVHFAAESLFRFYLTCCYLQVNHANLHGGQMPYWAAVSADHWVWRAVKVSFAPPFF